MFVFISLSYNVYALTEIKQKTEGNDSPATVVLPGGHYEPHYDISDKAIDALIDRVSLEINQKYSDCMDFAIDFQNKKLEELNHKLAELYIQEVGAPEEEAKKWAQEIIEKAPEIRKEIETKEKLKEKYNAEFSKNLIANVYKLFTCIFKTVDSKLLAFKELNPEVKYEIKEEYILFAKKSMPKNFYIARTAILPNGSQVEIICILGKLQRGIVSSCPTLEFNENFHNRRVQSFKLIPNYGGIKITLRDNIVQLPKTREVLNNVEYTTSGGTMLTEGLKEKFNETLTKFIRLAYAR